MSDDDDQENLDNVPDEEDSGRRLGARKRTTTSGLQLLILKIFFDKNISASGSVSGYSGYSGSMMSGPGGGDDDSDSELVASSSQPPERTRQKKFSKYFKDLPGEVATVRK